MKKVNNKKGFTLAELLVVVAILAILIAIAAPIFGGALSSATERVIQTNARAIKSAAMVKIMTDSTVPAASATGWKVEADVDGDGDITNLKVDAAASGDTDDLPDKPDDHYVVIVMPTDLG